jgi:DNA invertase Pin-like site-specific DNA recombinase
LLLCQGQKGRPSVAVEQEQLLLLRRQGFTAVQIAKQLGCSSSLVYKQLKAKNISMRNKYANITDNDLDSHVHAVYLEHSSVGIQVTIFSI